MIQHAIFTLQPYFVACFVSRPFLGVNSIDVFFQEGIGPLLFFGSTPMILAPPRPQVILFDFTYAVTYRSFVEMSPLEQHVSHNSASHHAMCPPHAHNSFRERENQRQPLTSTCPLCTTRSFCNHRAAKVINRLRHISDLYRGAGSNPPPAENSPCPR